MKNDSLAKDYIKRSVSRFRALESLYQDKNWADVMRESQELCELVLKALLRSCKIDPPRTHDVSQVLRDNQSLLPKSILKHLDELIKISKTLRRDRELAFYGSEDLTPSEFYQKEDADEAMKWAKFVLELVQKSIS